MGSYFLKKLNLSIRLEFKKYFDPNISVVESTRSDSRFTLILARAAVAQVRLLTLIL